MASGNGLRTEEAPGDDLGRFRERPFSSRLTPAERSV